jgi:hypothetical protein
LSPVFFGSVRVFGRVFSVSQRVRKRIEEIFRWVETTGGLRKSRHRGVSLVGWMFNLTVAACNVVRIPKLVAATG